MFRRLATSYRSPLVLALGACATVLADTTYRGRDSKFVSSIGQLATKEERRSVLRVEYEPGKGSLLGVGTYGTVRRGTELTTGRPVALKIVGKGLKSLGLEIEALRRVKECGGHPNIVGLLGVVSIEGDTTKCGLVFELLEGGELYESLVKHGAYSEHRASAVVRQVASALAFLHEECRIVHADLKPENLLLRTAQGDGATAICDFGSACVLDERGRFEFSDKRLLGTVAYAAPELLGSQYGSSAAKRFRDGGTTKVSTATAAVDVWSLGCILYVVLSGLHPFDPDNELSTDEELARVIVEGDWDFAAPAWRDVSASAKDLIKRMLERDPLKRISARDVLRHDWVRLPQRREIISGSDRRLIGFLRTQKRVQDHVFQLMVDGSLRRKVAKLEPSGQQQQRSEVAEEATSLQEVFKSIDVEGKGFITRTDIERTLSLKSNEHQASLGPDPSPSEQHGLGSEEEKVYYSSLNGLVGCGERVVYRPGEVVFRRGDPADSFYFVDRGKVLVAIAEEGTPSVEMGSGDFFGETALIKNQPRNATVTAGHRGAELIRFSRDDFDRLVAGSDAFKILDEQVRKRTLEHVKYVFSTLFHDRENVHLSFGDVLLKRGEPSTSMFYIIDGIADVLAPSGHVVAQRKEGETVGELGLVTGEPRSMDIVCGCKRGCAFKKLDRSDLERLLQFSPLAHAEIQNALTTRGVLDEKTRFSLPKERAAEIELRRRWTVAQGSAKPAVSASSDKVAS